MPILWTLEQDLALRLLSLDLVDVLADPEHSKELLGDRSRFGAAIRRELSEGYLVDSVLRLCHYSGVALDEHLPIAPVEEQRDFFNSWGAAGSPAVNLATLYARFPNAAHGVVQAAVGRGRGLTEYAGAVAWLLERGLDAGTLFVTPTISLPYAEELLGRLAASPLYLGAELN